MATEDENIDKEDGDSDTSVDSTLGALLGDIL